MSQPGVVSTRVRRTIRKSAWLSFACSTLFWGACGQTQKNSEAGPSTSTAAGGSESAPDETASTTSEGIASNAGGTLHSTSGATSTPSATATTGAMAAGAGGDPTSATTDRGAAGADPIGTVGTQTGTNGAGGSAEPDDDCEVDVFSLNEDLCQVETSCPEFVQHTNCRSYDSELWQCDTDEHDNSKPHTLDGNPAWLNTVTGTSDAAAACEAVVAVNLKRPSVMPSNVEACSEFSGKTTTSLSHFELCGPRYQATSGATVWDGVPASATCRESDDGLGQSCSCTNTETDDGDYRLESASLETALADVWSFCSNSSPSVPVERYECELIGEGPAADGSCDLTNYCQLAVTDDSGFELEQQVYESLSCTHETAGAALTCTCQFSSDHRFSFQARPESGVSACEDLASACDIRNTAERAEGAAECERRPAIVGRDRFLQSYACSTPVSLGGRSGLALDNSALQCTKQADGALSCTCHDDFAGTTVPLELDAASADVATTWELAVSQCEALLEEDPAAL